MKTETLQTKRHQDVQEFYADIAKDKDTQGCGCSPSCCGDERAHSLGYSSEEIASAPEGSNLNLGCGNPVAVASIREGETVLDLGSGAGFDCFIAARQLNGTGKVIGVDMTPEMIAKARANAERTGADNVEFRLGHIEKLPIDDSEVDLIISNCVVNLSPDKPAVFREAFRVLKPGGRLSISDVVARKPLPEEWRQDAKLVAQCAGAAETTSDLTAWITDAGFSKVEIEPRIQGDDLEQRTQEEVGGLGEYLFSAIITAHKSKS